MTDQSTTQLQRVFNVLKRGGWFTLEELASETGDPMPAISARIRDLRKPTFGGHTVERKQFKTTGKTWCYSITVNNSSVVPEPKPRRPKTPKTDEPPRVQFRRGQKLSFVTDDDGKVKVVADV